MIQNQIKYIPFLQENITDYNYKGDLYAYCIHEISQSLRPIDDFTFNFMLSKILCSSFSGA